MTNSTFINTCIVIGNGPSLRGFDLHRLNGFTTLGMNAAYRHWDQIGWYPTYYACLDDQLIKTHHAEIERLYAHGLVRKVFVHGSFFDYHPHRLIHPDFTSFDQTAGHWYYHNNAQALGWLPLYDRPAFKMSDKSKITTGAHSVRYVANLGHDRIVLLGVDLRYVEILPEADSTSDIGLIIKATPKRNPNYFFDSYQRAGDLYNIPNPVVHNGELHPRSFELISRDFKSNGVPCTVYNANRQSILSDRDLFPYVPIEEVLCESKLGSVMVPCQSSEIPLILANFELWNREEFSPVDRKTDGSRPALVFVFNNASARPEQVRIDAAFQAAGMKRFFSGVCFEYLDLEGERDAYIRDYSKSVGDHGYKAGPNYQFFAAIRRIAKYGRYTFLMECDCLPIRRGWLTRLQQLVNTAEPFWVMGSAYRGSHKLSKDYVRHLNGNAIYAAGDPEFQNFVTDFWEYHTWRLVRDKDKRLAYDCILEIMFSEDQIRDSQVMDTWKRTAHRFHYCDFLQNISGHEDIANLDESLISYLRRNSPDTYILHNRTVHKIVLTHHAEGRFDPVSSQDNDRGYPRLLMIDMTAAGNGTATGEIKSNLLADWPEAAFLQIAQHEKEGLSTVRREGARFATAGLAVGQGVDNIISAARKAIDSFAPDVVLYRPTSDTEALHRFAMNEIARQKKPLVTWIMDDWPARMEAESPDAWARMAPDLANLLAKSTTRLSIGESMSEAFVRRYGHPFQPLANGIDPADWLPISKPQRKEFVLRYAGGLAPDMNRDSVLRVASAVEKIALSGTKIRFEISTQPWWLDQCKGMFARHSATQLEQADKTIVEYRRWLAEADALVIAYNFDKPSLRYIRYSIANKMPECLASGAALLVHGPQEAATVHYLTHAEAAKIVDIPDEGALVKALTELAGNIETRAALAEASQRLAFEKFDVHRLRFKFTQILTQAAKIKFPHLDLPSYLAPNAVNTLNDVATMSESASIVLLRCSNLLLNNPSDGLARLRTDMTFAKKISKALSELPANSPLKTYFERVRTHAEAKDTISSIQ